MALYTPRPDTIARQVQGIILTEDVIPDNYRAYPPAMPVVVREPKIGPWTNNPNIGQTVAFAPDVNQRQYVLKMPEWGAPRVWSVCLGLDYTRPAHTSPGPPPFYYFDVTAEITFGAGGTTQTMEVDWKHGTILNLPCNTLSVIAKYGFPFSSPAFPPDLKLSAHVGEGVSSKPWTATRTLLNADNDGLNRSWIQVPRFAQRVVLYPRELGGIPSLLYTATTRITLITGLGARYISLTGDTLVNNRELIIPSATEYIQFENPAGFAATALTAIFELIG